jgi:tetratricopeptide (TPR) repeat protein
VVKRFALQSFMALTAMISLISPVLACLWDRDTLEQEKQRFPGALELITGQFPRHSASFYQWRVQDRTRQLADDPNAKLAYNDLAVAYEKLGEHDRAIQIIQQKEEKWPGEYETAANLGTFYVHRGDYEKGIAEIQRAIEINPDAHFGREIYQKLLVEYILSRQADGVVKLPLDPNPGSPHQPQGFADWVLASRRVDLANMDEVAEELGRAQKGVLGMMRFGHYNSPILLEALSDLLGSGQDGDAKRLAVRALLKAAYETEGDVSVAYREKAESALVMQTISPQKERQLPLKELEARFQQELKAAQKWYRALEANEKRWIEQGLDPEAEFLKQYSEKPGTSRQGQLVPPSNWGWGIFGVLIPIALVAVYRVWRR